VPHGFLSGYLRCWGPPEYEELTPEDKDYFRGLVAKGRDALVNHVETCKRAVLRGGLGDQVRDEWLGIIGLSNFDLAKGFPQAKRDWLGKMIDDMYPLLVRLDPDSAPAAQAGAARPVPMDLITTEVAVAEFCTSRATIRRKVKAGALHDYSRRGHAATPPPLRSDQLFALGQKQLPAPEIQRRPLVRFDKTADVFASLLPIRRLDPTPQLPNAPVPVRPHLLALP
jgi:hypothetical protein